MELANALGLQPMMMRVDWRRKHPKQGQMLEAARNARYELMLDACRRLGARTLLTAHHAGVLAWVVMKMWPPKEHVMTLGLQNAVVGHALEMHWHHGTRQAVLLSRSPL